MTNLRSLRSEADNLEQRAQGAQQDAQRICAESAQQSAGGNPGQARLSRERQRTKSAKQLITAAKPSKNRQK